MSFYLKASSKDKKVLEQFTNFLSRLKILPAILKHLPEQKKRNFFTILNSPHVNKTAQEQFEFRVFNSHFLLDSFKKFYLLLFFKNIKNVSFSGLKLELKNLISINQNTYKQLKIVNPDNVNLTTKALEVKKLQYIQLFDCYGELYLKNFIQTKTN